MSEALEKALVDNGTLTEKELVIAKLECDYPGIIEALFGPGDLNNIIPEGGGGAS